jgi:hypothetical protein
MTSSATPYPDGESLLAEARGAAGLADFGPGGFQDGLEALLGSLRRDAELTPEGAAIALAVVRRRLRNRLEIQEWLRTHPEVGNLSIDGPASIIGLPRTGTTAIGNMMSLDDQFRSLRKWEQSKPSPPPILETEAVDPRRVAAVQSLVQLARDQPRHAMMHISEADASTEDTEVLGLEFKAQQFTLPVFGYHAWWRDCDMRPAYVYHRRVAQLLQSRRPPNLWLFKAPHQKFHLEAFLAAYPDARFIMMHRDPAKVAPSYASLVHSLFPPGSGAGHDPQRLGPHVAEHLRIGMERAIAARARIGEGRFLDIHHTEFQRDALGVLQRVYNFLGLELRPQVRDRMLQWAKINRSGSHGVHHYTAEQFGLTEAQLRSDYDFYIRRFDVPLEI